MSNDEFLTGVEYPHPFDELAVELCQSASRYVCILSPALDHAAFDSEALSDSLSQFARSSPKTNVRILVRDPRNIVANGHRLLLLARRIPSKVFIQKLEDHPDWNNETIVIRDRDGVLYKPGGSDHDAFYEPNSRASTQRHLDLFDDLWRYSVQDPNLRSLSI
jgi:hypothetical protein